MVFLERLASTVTFGYDEWRNFIGGDKQCFVPVKTFAWRDAGPYQPCYAGVFARLFEHGLTQIPSGLITWFIAMPEHACIQAPFPPSCSITHQTLALWNLLVISLFSLKLISRTGMLCFGAGLELGVDVPCACRECFTLRPLLISLWFQLSCLRFLSSKQSDADVIGCNYKCTAELLELKFSGRHHSQDAACSRHHLNPYKPMYTT